MSRELKLCPFCGARAEIYFEPDEESPENKHRWIIVCRSCASSTGYAISRENVIEAWNTRKPTKAEIDEMVEREG